MNLKIYQKYYIKCLFIDNKLKNYSECISEFKKNFLTMNFYYLKI